MTEFHLTGNVAVGYGGADRVVLTIHQEESMKRIFATLQERAPQILIAAAVVVGIAIVLDGAAARGINGIAGLMWFLAAGLLIRFTIKQSGGWTTFGLTIVISFVLVLLVKPSDLMWAAIGFTIGGALVALVARSEREKAALLLPAIWLPTHLLVAIGRVAERAIRDQPARVRTDPPPTAALVPLAMVIAALVGGLIVVWWLERKEQRAIVAASATGNDW